MSRNATDAPGPLQGCPVCKGCCRAGAWLFNRIGHHAAALFIGLLHAALSLYYMHARGLSMTADPKANSWDFFWQTLPMEAMKDDLPGSLWHLHAQPPLFNLYGFIMRGLFGGRGQLTGQHYTQILLGSLMCAMFYPTLRHLTRRPRLAFAAALFISLNPPIFLYESFILYTLLAGFLVTWAVYAMVRYAETHRLRDLAGVIAIVNVLMLTRSAFHLVLMIPIAVLALILETRRWKQVGALCMLLTLPTVGWYAKNHVEFGFFGASSWMGSNLYRIVSANYSRSELRALADQGVVQPAAAEQGYFDPPSDFVPYGFDKASPVDVLSRDDYNNINMINISRMHLLNAKRLKRHDPQHYWSNVVRAYGFFCKPSHETRPLSVNTRRMLPHVHVFQYVNGSKLAQAINATWGTRFTSLYQVLIPAVLLMFLARAVLRGRLSWSRWLVFLRHNPVATLMALLIFYVTAVSSLYEYGENCRFKFSIEAVILMLAMAMVTPAPGRKAD
jgi:hypothetical protein